MTNRPTTNQAIAPELRRWTEAAQWILCLVLLTLICLVVFDAKWVLKPYVAPTLGKAAPALAAKTAVPGAGTEHPTTPVVAPSDSAPAPPEASASKSPIAAPAQALALAPSANLEVIAPREGVTGDAIEVRVGLRGSSAERRAQVVLEYDANALRLFEPEQEHQGVAEATLHSTGAGKEFGRVAFGFEVIVGEKQPTSVMASATTFDAAGNVLRTLPPTQQEILLRP